MTVYMSLYRESFILILLFACLYLTHERNNMHFDGELVFIFVSFYHVFHDIYHMSYFSPG